jgi:hypothetical protein
MSTPEPVTEPAQQPMSKKQQRKKNKAVTVVEPIEALEEHPIEEAHFDYPAYVIEDGYSIWTVAKSFFGGFGTGVVVTALTFGYLRAQEIQRAHEDFILTELPRAEGQRLNPSPSAEQPSANI